MNRWIRFRLGLTFVAFLSFFAVIALRLVQLQVTGSPQLKLLAKKQFERVRHKVSARLPIYDRNGEELAVSLPAGSIFARPKLIRNRREAARVLAKVLGGTPGKWYSRLRTRKPFLWIQRQVSPMVAQIIKQQKLPGVFFERENRRFYPNGELAAHVLGFADIDGKGISGLELTQHQLLLPNSESVKILRDGKGNLSYIEGSEAEATKADGGLFLTLDRRVQYIVEEELARAVDRSGAVAAVGIVMDPKTGEILAMGQWPSFDPNHAKQYAPSSFVNRSTSHLFEPGSTVKVLFASAAIDEGLLNRSTPIDCGFGSITFGTKKISEAESNHRYGLLPLERVIQNSSNVGAVRIVQLLGVDRVRSVLQRFGLTDKTGIELPGEVAAPVKPTSLWTPFLLATVGFGQGIAVTPLQMVTAFAPIANGGFLVRPTLVLSEHGGKDFQPIQRILSVDTVRTIGEILAGAVDGKLATGRLAKVPGIPVAGKTGTAQKYEVGGGYDGQKYFSSFIGFLPVDRPEILVGIFVDEPRHPYYASQVAAPVFRRIAERSLQVLGRLPVQRVVHNSDPARSAAPSSPSEPLVAKDGIWMMPDLRGAGMREVFRAIGKYFNNIRITGNGYVDNQSPQPGTVVTRNTHVYLYFSDSPSESAGREYRLSTVP